MSMKRKITALLALLLALLCASGFAAADVSPTTGLATEEGSLFRPVLVQIGNIEAARPQIRFCDADIVYEYIYWGPAHTQYLAVFNDVHPVWAGPVRATRVTGVELAAPWRAPFAFLGGLQPTGMDIYAKMDELEFPSALSIDGTRTESPNTVFKRAENREAPNNLQVSTTYLAQEGWPVDNNTGEPYIAVPPDTLRFVQSPPEGGEAAMEVRVAYDEKEYIPSYLYDGGVQAYARYYNGVLQVDEETGAGIMVSNVIVQYCEMEYYQQEAAQPIISTVGEGRAEVYVAGQRFEGIWSRETAKDHIAYTGTDGNPLPLLPGKTYVQIVPAEFQMVEGEEGIWILQ